MDETEEKSEIRELIDSSEIIIPEELKGDIEFFKSLKDTYDDVDSVRENLVAKLFLANIQTFSESKYWDGFDLVNADRYQMFDYIVEKSDFVYELSKRENRTHYLVYLIRNKLNGK